MSEEHPVFPPPDNKDCRIWRYMDFTKYVWLLQERALFFARVDKLGDPFEGSFSRANEKLRPILYKDLQQQVNKDGADNPMSKLYEFARHAAKWTYVNCWHQNEYESAAMWKLYGKTSEAIAIQSTYQRLFDCLPENTYCGRITYLDYDTDWLPEDNVFSPFMHKRKSFEHEHEVRALVQDIPRIENTLDLLGPNPDEGRPVPIDLDGLIERVFVSPDSPAWFFGLVNTVSRQLNNNKPVIQSSLNAAPFY